MSPEFTDRVIGIYHFLGDRTPGNVPVVSPRPRRENPWRQDGKAIVTRVAAGDNLKTSVEQVLELLGPLSAAISRGERVMIKPNFNSADPSPASTDLEFLRVIIEILGDAGARITIGESSGGMWRPTRKVFHKLGLYDFARKLGVGLIAFDDPDQQWVRIPIPGEYFNHLTMPRAAYESDRLVYLPCLKTHGLARFSGSLKLAFGFVHPGERVPFHIDHRQEKLAEVNLCWLPDLVIMDGRKAFVSGGPDRGKRAYPGLLMASGDPVALDAEAVKILAMCGASLPAEPWRLPQIATALKHGLGASKDGYLVRENAPVTPVC